MPDRETLRLTKWDGTYHGVAAASVGTCAVSALAQKTCFAPGVFCEHDSLKNHGFRGQCVRGFVSRERAIGHQEESTTRGEMSSAA